MTERMVRVGEVDLCVETFGSPTDPTVLLIHGACASMLWWPRDLCEQLAARKRHVVRYDSRDTGRSTSFPVGAPPYGLRDLADDAVGLLDALGVDVAHVVGRSAGGAVALVAALDHPGRVASLTLVGCTTGDEDLPPMTPAFLDASAANDPQDPVGTIVALVRAYGGASPYVDEAAIRAVAVEDVVRTIDLDAALTNHLVMGLDGPRHGGPADVTAPTLVVHGDLDPVFPLAHGHALADAIPGAQLLVLEDTGHDLPEVHTPAVLDAVVALGAAEASRSARTAGLRGAVRGRVVLPTDECFDQARSPWNLAVDQPVGAVVEALDVDDVAATVRYAAAHGLHVAVQPRGHGASGRVDGDEVLLRTGRLDHVLIDPLTRLARIGAGVASGALQTAAARHGLSGLPGSSPVVSVVGSLLGGGLSWFGRRYGWASDRARRFHVVDATGRRRWVGPDDPDLFWALRGGGGDVAVVTEVELELVSVPAVYGGRVLWPAVRAADVLAAYREITASAPETLTVWWDLLRFPGAEPLVAVDATFLGDPREAAALLRPLETVPGALSDGRGPTAVDALEAITAEPTDPGPGLSRAALLGALDEAAAGTLLATPTDALLSVQVRHLDGALGRPGDHGAAGEIRLPFLLYTFGIPTTPGVATRVVDQQRALVEALGDHVGPRVPLTFLGPGQGARDAFDPETLDRLRRVKDAVDPTGLLRSNHPVREVGRPHR